MTSRQIVAMPLIPGRIRRGQETRSDLGYARYGRAAWQWWCRQHGIEFVVFDSPLGGRDFSQMPPTIQRWLIPGLLMDESNQDVTVAIVDADTMIRWDAPNFLELSLGFSAVAAASPMWVIHSMRAFQHLFPGVLLPWWEYINTGIVVLGGKQLRLLRAFLEHSATHWPELEAIMLSGDFGTDQTPLNLMLRRENEPVHFLPRPFNFLHCFPMEPELWPFECSPSPDLAQFAGKAFGRPWAFEFIEAGYVWHFSNIVTMRAAVMRETWRRVCAHYPGSEIDPGDAPEKSPGEVLARVACGPG